MPVIVSQSTTGGIHHIAQHIQTIGDGRDMSLAGLKPQALYIKPLANPCPDLGQSLFVLVQDDDIVHIAQVRPNHPYQLDLIIEIVQVQIGKKLTCQMANGKP